MSRKKIIKALKQIQADSLALFVKLHNYNLNVEGMNFMAVQNATESLYDAMAKLFKDSGEQIILLDEKPLVTPEDLIKNTRIKSDENLSMDVAYISESVQKDLAVMIRDMEELDGVCTDEEKTLKDFAANHLLFFKGEAETFSAL